MSSYTWQYLNISGGGPFSYSNTDGVPPSGDLGNGVVNQSTITLISSPIVTTQQMVFTTPPVITTIQSLSGNILTLPTSNTTLVGNDTVDTLTNKTITNPVLSYVGTTPSSSQSGLMLYSRSTINGPRTININNGVEPIFQLQPSFTSRRFGLWAALPGSTTPATINFSNSVTGTAVAQAKANTNAILSSNCILYRNTTALTNAAAGTRLGANILWRGNSITSGGFYYVARVGIKAAPVASAMKLFVGLTSSTAVLVSASATSSLTADNANFICIGADNGDTNWQFISRATTSASWSKINLGISRNNTSDIAEIALYGAAGSSGITYSVGYLGTSSFTLGYANTNNIPSNTTFIGPQIYANTGTITTTFSLAVCLQYYDTINDA